MYERSSKITGRSKDVLTIENFPLFINFTNSNANMIVVKERIARDIGISFQSQGNGIIDIGNMKSKIYNKYL